jgi:peptidoglycan glycosyltransferase
MSTTRRLLLKTRSAFPGGPWGRMLVFVALLVAGAQAIGAASMEQGLVEPERVAAYERRGFEVVAREGTETAPPSLVVSRERDGVTITRSVGEHLEQRRALGLVLRPAAAAFLAFALLHLLAWIATGRPTDRSLVRWDRSLPVLWLVPVGVSILLLSRLALDVPAASPSRFPSALSWASRQSDAAVLAALALPLAATIAALMERRDWFQAAMRRPLLGPARRYDLLLVGACGLFAAVGLLGRKSFGATVSIDVGGASLQVVEAAKLLLVLHAAYMLADLDRDASWPETFDTRPWTPAIARLLATVGLAGGSALVFSGDLGTATLAAAIPLLAGLAATGSVALLGYSAAAGALGLGSILLLHRPGYAWQRIVAVAAPFERSETLAGIRWALAEGGALGTGLGSGSPQAIPNVDSDFILAAVGEELGWFGISLVLLSTVALVHRGLIAAVREEEALRKHLAAAAALSLGAQAVVITAGTLGLLPATGVPYPFVSRGGASLLVNSAMVGILAQVSFGAGAEAARGLHPWNQWLVLLRRLRWTAAGGIVVLLGCQGWAGWLMLGRPGADVDRPYLDRGKADLVAHLVQAGVFVADGGRVGVRAERLEDAARGLPPEQRRRVRVAGGLVDGRPLSAIAGALRTEADTVLAPGSLWSIRNPRRRSGVPFSIVDRADRLLAGTRKGRRVHPYGARGFPVTGHRDHGTASFLEADAAEALRRLTRREAMLLTDRMRQRFVRLLHGELGFAPATGPYVVHSTIDGRVQDNAMDALAGRRGAALAVDLKTGDLLALAAFPTLDPDGLSRGALDDAFTDPDTRLRSHRALRERYPPGSLMKMVTAAALLADGVALDPAQSTCSGRDDGLAVGDAGGGQHGALDLEDAVAKSCNVYFARAGVALGRRLPVMARAFGFGGARALVPWTDGGDLQTAPSHILTCHSVSGSGELPRACRGADPLAPAPGSYLDANPSLLARAAFGQTVVEATPLQMLEVVATIANDGRRPVLRVIDRVSARCGERPCVLAAALPDDERVLSARVAAGVRAGMELGYREGTARPANLRLRLGRGGSRYTLERRPAHPVAVGSKTGTAQVEGGDDHAWFAAYAPAEDPRVAVVVVVEHGGAGVVAAGPVAMRVLRDALNAVK